MMTPGTQRGPEHRFSANTGSPAANLGEQWTFLSKTSADFLDCIEGRRQEKRVRSSRRMSRLLGVSFVAAWGVDLYASNIRETLSSRDPGSESIFFIWCLKYCTYLSAIPFEAGWPTGVGVCLMWFFCRKSWNSSLMNWVPLSVTTCSGIPNVANRRRSWEMVEEAEMRVILKISSHLE